MGKYERLERLIRINTLIRANLGPSRSEPGAVLRSAFCEDDMAKHGSTQLYFAKDNRKLVGSKFG
ncbi:hypothetical protein ACFL6S_12960 [Candidatus Poribacteria bacterium]